MHWPSLEKDPKHEVHIARGTWKVLSAVLQPSLVALDHQMSVHASELSQECPGISELSWFRLQPARRESWEEFVWEVGIPHSLLNRKIICLNYKSAGVIHSEAHPWTLKKDNVDLLIVLLEKHIVLSCLESES